MTIASEIQRIQNNIADAYTSCNSKGATMPATQNSANLANCIDSISGGGDGGKKFGMTAEDYFYSFPHNNTTLDTTAPNVDMSSETGSFSSYTMHYFFQWSRVKSVSTPYFNNSSTYIFAYMFQNNKCIQYVKINTSRTDISANYCIYNNVNNASNVKVEVVNFAPNTVIRGQYNIYSTAIYNYLVLLKEFYWLFGGISG